VFGALVLVVGGAVALLVVLSNGDEKGEAQEPGALVEAGSSQLPPEPDPEPPEPVPEPDPGPPSSGDSGELDVEAALGLARELVEAEDFQDAVDRATEVLARAPGEPRAHDIIGQAHQGRGDYEAAIEAFEAAVEADPANAVFQDHLGAAISATAPASIQPIADQQVGRWPEELGTAGQAVWVANSGSASVSQLDNASGLTADTVAVGRLPVDLEPAAGNGLWILAHTDQTLWRLDASSNTAVIHATLPDCPTDMTSGSMDAVFVLLTEQCSSGDSSIVRVATDSGAQSESDLLQLRDTRAIQAVGDQLWVGSSETGLWLVDPDNFELMGRLLEDTSVRSLTTDGEYLLVDAFSTIYRVGPDFSVVALATLDDPVVRMYATERFVVAAGSSGRVFFIATAVPGQVTTVDLEIGAVNVGSVHIAGDVMFVSHYSPFDDSVGWVSSYGLTPAGST